MVSIRLPKRSQEILESEVKKRIVKLVFSAHRHIIENTPVDTGRLRSSIIIEETKSGFLIGTNVEYAEAIELGVRPHVILPSNKKALFWAGAAHPVKKVNHPGFSGRGMFEKGVAYLEQNAQAFLR
jgi:hypothetical protein